ncbi:Shedu anti-phage system protein SduA domain-containing protein [Rhodoferax mekongensis]|uniref:DUF4263 domain-containing protein n=1 Tax=Rhodoferax mekongensis TaxID=3068341 RepID=A0ABZ0AWI7_9BURK|nr:Shedu anti-phage system protein SduA domain-containing protein [Rhodoferax sp. TBRC 17307]WNO03971.1 DUF4263 domain-containing protein [Rhodoferax sp. TBRC 17307]
MTAPLPVAPALIGSQGALGVHSFKRKDARTETKELAFWLETENSKKPLKERDQVLRFFQLRKQLCALTGMVWGNLLQPDRFAFELNLGGAYRPDFVVGCTKSKNVLLVEFEDAESTSLFRRANDLDPNELRPKLGSRLLGGMSQITDWVYYIDTASATHKKQWFTFEPNNVQALLVVGRDHYFDKYGANDSTRYQWLQDKFRIGGLPIFIRSYDGLKDDLMARLVTYS